MGQAYQSLESEYLKGNLNQVQRRFFEARPFEEFYDLVKDPDPVVNIIREPRTKSIVSHMRTELDAHML